MSFNLKTYLEDCATKLKAIGHTSQNKRFFVVSSISTLEGLLGSIGRGGFPAIVAHDAADGTVGDTSNSENFIDRPDYTFYVIDQVTKLNDTDAMELAKRTTKELGFKIVARMLRHRKQATRTGTDPYGLMLFNKASISYQAIGPIGNGCFGTMFFINIPQPVSLVYNDDDWSE